MTWRHFGVLLIVNLAWSTNTIVSKFAIGVLGVPPLFYTAARFGLVAAMLAPWLLPLPPRLLRLAIVGLLVGGLNFGLFFAGLRTADASSATVVAQIGVPITLLLSVFILGEQIGWRRGLGIALALVGVALVTWDPRGMTLSVGLLYVCASAASLALGSVLMKQWPSLPPLQFQGWVGVFSFVPLALASLLLEHRQLATVVDPGWMMVASAVYSAGVGSVIGFAAYFSLMQKYEVGMLVPLTLLTPLMTIALGMILFGEALDARTIIGATLALTGVIVIVIRTNPLVPFAEFFRNRS